MDVADEFWNRACIAPPPKFSEEYSRDDDETDIYELVRFLWPKTKVLHEFLEDIKGMEIWTQETSRLYNLMQSYKKFRRDKFYHLLNLIRRCERRLTQMKIPHHVSELLKLIPAPVTIGSLSSVHLPTRSMFEYLLTRVYGAFHLFLKIQTQCLAVARIILGRYSGRGHFCFVTLSILAIMARLRVLSIRFANVFAEFYDEILPHLESLKGKSKFSIMERDSSLVSKFMDHLRAEKDTALSNNVREKLADSIDSEVLDKFSESTNFLEVLFSKVNSNLDSKTPSVSGTSSGIARIDSNVKTPYKPNPILIDLELKGETSLGVEEKNDLLSLLDIFDDDDETEIKVEQPSKSLLSTELTSSLRPSYDEDLGDVIDLNTIQEGRDFISKSPHRNGEALSKGKKCKKYSDEIKSSKGMKDSGKKSNKKVKKIICDDVALPSKSKPKKSSEKMEDLVSLSETHAVAPKSKLTKSSGKTKDFNKLSKTIAPNGNLQGKKKRKLEEDSSEGLLDTNANQKIKKKKRKS